MKAMATKSKYMKGLKLLAGIKTWEVRQATLSLCKNEGVLPHGMINCPSLVFGVQGKGVVIVLNSVQKGNHFMQ